MHWKISSYSKKRKEKEKKIRKKPGYSASFHFHVFGLASLFSVAHKSLQCYIPQWMVKILTRCPSHSKMYELIRTNIELVLRSVYFSARHRHLEIMRRGNQIRSVDGYRQFFDIFFRYLKEVLRVRALGSGWPIWLNSPLDAALFIAMTRIRHRSGRYVKFRTSQSHLDGIEFSAGFVAHFSRFNTPFF